MGRCGTSTTFVTSRESDLAGLRVGDGRYETVRVVMQGHRQLVARVHEQITAHLRSEGGERRVHWTRRCVRDAVLGASATGNVTGSAARSARKLCRYAMSWR